MTVSTLKAVSADTKQWAEKAKTCLKQAEEIGKRVEGRYARQQHVQSAIPPNFYTQQEVKYTILAAEAFRVCGENHWYDSANAYGRAATLCSDALHDSEKSAILFVEAGVVMEKLDCNFANEFYKKAVSQYCNASDFVSAALLQERLAHNFEKKGDDTVAIKEYKSASKLYNAAKKTDDSDRILERSAYLLGMNGKFRESSSVYRTLAIRHTHENIKTFNSSLMLLQSSLLLLHANLLESTDVDLSEVVSLVEQVNRLDCRVSPQHDFIADVIQCVRDEFQLDIFADCVYSFNTICSEPNELMLLTLKGIKQSMSTKKGGSAGNNS